MNHPALVMRLRAAVAAHLPADLEQLLADHGLVGFAAAVAACSPRVAADAVSMLPSAQRTAVSRHLPSCLRTTLSAGRKEPSAAASLVRPPPLLERIASVWRRRAA